MLNRNPDFLASLAVALAAAIWLAFIRNATEDEIADAIAHAATRHGPAAAECLSVAIAQEAPVTVLQLRRMQRRLEPPPIPAPDDAVGCAVAAY